MGFDVEKTQTCVPLFILADCSSSMSGEKINSCNQSIKDMVRELQSDESTKDSVDVTFITFNTTAQLVNSPTSVNSFNFKELIANGSTSLGHAISIVTNEIDCYIQDAKTNKKKITAPHIICFTDGYPTDIWEDKLNTLTGKHPYSVRIALAIEFGSDKADLNMLKRFVSKDKEGQRELLFTATDASSIKNFFRYTTRLTKASSQGINVTPPSTNNNGSIIVP